MCTVVDTLTPMSMLWKHPQFDQVHVMTYLNDERLSVPVDQRRYAGETLGAALIWAATVLSKLDLLTADRRQQASSRG